MGGAAVGAARNAGTDDVGAVEEEERTRLSIWLGGTGFSWNRFAGARLVSLDARTG